MLFTVMTALVSNTLLASSYLEGCTWETEFSVSQSEFRCSTNKYPISGGCHHQDLDGTRQTKDVGPKYAEPGVVKNNRQWKCDLENDDREPTKILPMLCCRVPFVVQNTVDIRAGVAESYLSATQGNWQYYKIEIGEDESELDVESWNSFSGQDLDLYVQKNVKPTLNSYICKSTSFDNSEQCKIEDIGSGIYYIGLYAYRTFSGVSVQANVRKTDTSDPVGIYVNEAEQGLAAQFGQWRYFKVPVGYDDEPSVSFALLNAHYAEDADLYIRKHYPPKTDNYDCRSTSSDNTEECVLNNPEPGVYYVGIHAYQAYSDLTLLVSTDEADDDSTCQLPAWNSLATYQYGDSVSHNNHEWEVIHLHSAPGWEPGDPVLWNVWLDLGECQ
jgi:hypothetical protein